MQPLPSFTWAQWQTVLLLAAINFTHILDFVIVMPLGDQLRDELSINPQQFGFIVAAYGLCAMVTGIAASTFIDKFDRKTVLLTSFAGFIVTTFCCGIAPSYRELLAARALAGVCGGIVASSIMAYIGDTIQAELRGRALGVVTSSFAVASVLGLPLGLYLATWYHHFSAPFLAIAALGVVVWLAAASNLPSLKDHINRPDRQPVFNEFAVVIRQRSHLYSFVFMLSMVLGTFMIVPYIATYMEANCQLPRGTLPWLYAIGGISSLLFMNLSGWLTDRFGARPIFLACAGLAVIMTLVITNLPPVAAWLSVVVSAMFMTFASSRVVPAQAMMLRAADPKTRGAFMSLNSAVSHFSTAIGPMIAGAIIGEEYEGGPLTHYGLVGLLAACFGVSAMVLSFKLGAPVSQASGQ